VHAAQCCCEYLTDVSLACAEPISGTRSPGSNGVCQRLGGAPIDAGYLNYMRKVVLANLAMIVCHIYLGGPNSRSLLLQARQGSVRPDSEVHT